MNSDKEKQDKLEVAFINLDYFIVTTQRFGACHDTSAIFYMIASELGFNPVLRIGEVRDPDTGFYFDHSWVEINEAVYDVAIAYPNRCGVKVSGPIFDSVDLESGSITNLEFGFHSDSGLDEIALDVSKMTLDDYETVSNAGIWNITVSQGELIDLSLDTELLCLQYGDVTREIV